MPLGVVLGSTVAVARNRILLRVQGAYGLFTVYEMALWVAVLLWAYSVGGAGFAGVVAIAQYVPASLLAPVGGSVADRLPRDVALRLGYLAQGVAMGSLALLLITGSRVGVVVTASVSCVLIAWTRPPHYAAAAELSQTPGQVAAANSLSGTSERAGYFVGPVLAGLGTAWAGLTGIVVVCAVMALIAAGLLSGIRLGRPAGTGDSATGSPAAVSLTAELVRRPVVALMLVVIGLGFLTEGCLELLAIAYVSQHLGRGNAAAGLLIGAVGLGGILGAAAAIVLVGWRRLAPGVAGSLLAGGLPLLGFLLLSGLGSAVAVLVVVGAALAFFAVAGLTLLQRSVADSLMARILAARESAMLAGMAVGTALAPLLVRWFGSAGGYVVLGGALTVVAVAAVPLLVRLDAAAVYRPGLVPLLRQVVFLAVLDVQALERLAHGAVELQVATGTDVVRQGEPGGLFYVVEDGELEVSVHGRPDTVRIGPGSGFGEIALLRQVPRTATVRSLTTCRLWTIDRELFLATVAGSAGHDVAERVIDAQLRRLSSEPSQ